MRNCSLLALSTLLLLATGCGSLRSVEVVGTELSNSANRFLSLLDPEQRKAAQRGLNDVEAVKWHFVPGRYAGVEMGALDATQKAAAHDVLRTMLSATGFAKTMAITDLESVLRAMESRPGKDAAHRDPDRYAMLICGEPESGGTFVVRFQGHHVSLRMWVVDGLLVGHTPHFLGTSPHRVPERIGNLGKLEMRMVAYEDYQKDGVKFQLAIERQRLEAWLKEPNNKAQVDKDPRNIRRFNESLTGPLAAGRLAWFPREIKPDMRSPDTWGRSYTMIPGLEQQAVRFFDDTQYNNGIVPEAVKQLTAKKQRLIEFVAINMAETSFSGDDCDPTGFSVGTSYNDLPGVNYKITSAKSSEYADWSQEHIGKSCAIILNNYVSSAPTFRSRIAGRGIITGDFTVAEADDLVKTLRTDSRRFARTPVLEREEALARALMMDFSDQERSRVLISETAPPDVLLGPGKSPSALGERRGMPWSAMNKGQQDKLWRLLQEHAHVLRPDVAKSDLERIRANGLAEMSFAWAGSVEPGKGHYYRIHGNHFAIEYDCTQNDANHVHVVWRDFENDHGGTPLRLHMLQQHGK